MTEVAEKFDEPLEKVLDSLIQTSDKVSVVADSLTVQIRLSEGASQLLVKRFVVDNHLEFQAL